MKQTIIIHGAAEEKEFYSKKFPSPSNTQWLPWLQKQLSLRDQISQTPEMPRPFDPIYEDWVKVFEQFTLNSETVLIGHSCGGGFLLRYLSEHPDLKVAKVFLIAPWLDPEHFFSTDFFKFEIDSNLPKRFPLHIFMSADDFKSLLESFKIIKEKLPDAIYHEFSDKHHFCTPEFPELLELL